MNKILKAIMMTILLTLISVSAKASDMSYYNSKGWDEYGGIIVKASYLSQVSVVELTTFTSIESNFNPHIKNKYSTATGLMQFIHSTWKAQLRKYGEKYGLSMNTKPTDAYANALMAAEYIKENDDYLESRLNRKPTLSEKYLAHLFGANGAYKVITSSGSSYITKVVGGRCGRHGNGNLYCRDGKSKTVWRFKHDIQNLVEDHKADYKQIALTAYNRYALNKEMDNLVNAIRNGTKPIHGDDVYFQEI